MELKEITDWFELYPKENIKENCILKCNGCNEFSNHNDWTETEVYCEDCGSHFAIKCPKCEERFDHVYSEPIECK